MNTIDFIHRISREDKPPEAPKDEPGISLSLDEDFISINDAGTIRAHATVKIDFSGFGGGILELRGMHIEVKKNQIATIKVPEFTLRGIPAVSYHLSVELTAAIGAALERIAGVASRGAM